MVDISDSVDSFSYSLYMRSAIYGLVARDGDLKRRDDLQ